MSPRSFVDLDAYKYAAELADAIHSQVMAWDKIHHIARGSLRETEHWLARATTRGLLPAGRFDGQVVRVAKTLSGLIGRSNSRLT